MLDKYFRSGLRGLEVDERLAKAQQEEIKVKKALAESQANLANAQANLANSNFNKEVSEKAMAM